jgi:hypothetical protein
MQYVNRITFFAEAKRLQYVINGSVFWNVTPCRPLQAIIYWDHELYLYVGLKSKPSSESENAEILLVSVTSRSSN